MFGHVVDDAEPVRSLGHPPHPDCLGKAYRHQVADFSMPRRMALGP